MNYLRHVQRAIDYIEDHLEEALEPGDVARYVGVSRWHFQRIFKGLTNETLKSYIRARRLSNALRRLVGSDARTLDIALAAGFTSQAAFTRVFRAAFGRTPAKLRRSGAGNQFVGKLRIDEGYIRHLHDRVSLEPEYVRIRPMSLVGLKTTFYGVDSDKNNLGEKLPRLWDAFLARLDQVNHAQPDLCYGVVQPVADSERLDYLACVAVTRRAAVPEGMSTLQLPAATYARFVHRGFPADLNATVSYIYGNWLLRSRRKHTLAPDLEIYGPDYVPDTEHSVIRYAVPVTKLVL